MRTPVNLDMMLMHQALPKCKDKLNAVNTLQGA